MMVISFLSPIIDFEGVRVGFVDGGKQITRLDRFYIVFDEGLCLFYLRAEQNENMSIILALSEKIAVIPTQNYTLVFLKIDAYNLLFHLLLYRIGNNKPCISYEPLLLPLISIVYIIRAQHSNSQPVFSPFSPFYRPYYNRLQDSKLIISDLYCSHFHVSDEMEQLEPIDDLKILHILLQKSAPILELYNSKMEKPKYRIRIMSELGHVAPALCPQVEVDEPLIGLY